MISVGECDRHAKKVLYVEGSVAEWSKALVLGTSLFGGVGSNPTAAITFLTSRFFYLRTKFYMGEIKGNCDFLGIVLKI